MPTRPFTDLADTSNAPVEKSKVFLQVFAEDTTDGLVGQKSLALSGYTVSVKANFDVQGYPTTAGTTVLGRSVAASDAESVARLRRAGARLLGHTHMTELAYSGLGLNAHFDTPNNPILHGAIAGGSTSGGAVSVATGMADIALGSDTGGSLRIPAAFCGVVGFKPSQSSVPSDGCLPLSQQLDSVGPIARNVAACRLAWQVLSDTVGSQMLAPLQIVVPKNFGFDELDEAVEQGFKWAVSAMQHAGIMVQTDSMDLFERYKKIPVWQFSAYESRRYYAQLYDAHCEQLDPRVRKRMARGEEVSDEAFAQTCQDRNALIQAFEMQQPNTVYLMPTVACAPPMRSRLDDDQEYDRMNLLCLRNTSFANVIDGCSISLPMDYKGVPMGLMLTALQGRDQALLDLAERIESALATYSGDQ